MKTIWVDERQIEAFAAHLRNSGAARPFDFCSLSEGFLYPGRGRDGVLEYFFFACAHQFGFWTLQDGRWTAPMVARLDGRGLKGSDFLWRAATRAWQKNPRVFFPDALAALSDRQLDEVFHDDTGVNPLPMWPEHLALICGYARWFTVRNTAPAELLRRAQAAAKPLQALLAALAEIPGYAEDPLQKKAMLLAIALENRPEHFLQVADPESAVPIIDYHLQRSALRTGLVRVEPSALRRKLEARELLAADEEAAIRRATCEAIAKLVARSGLSAAAVDWFFFQNRTGCPEIAAPDCPACPVQAHCTALRRDTVEFRPLPTARDKRIDIVMACVILCRGDRFFIQQRLADDIWGGLWEFPGGRLEENETPLAAARRELVEETGWQVERLEPLDTVIHHYTRYRVTLHAFIAALPGDAGAARLTAAQQSAWVTAAQLADYPFPAGHRRLAQHLRRQLSGKTGTALTAKKTSRS